MATKNKPEAQNPLILRSQRLMEAFAKSDDERDFYLDRVEGFIIYVDLDKPQHDLESLEKELTVHADRYCMIPKLTFYETKKIMEGFVNEKVYDIDTKEKLLDIIQSKEARENFLEFIYDHHSELEKWQQYYQERSRIRIIEWLRNNHFHFVFEEDLDLAKSLIEKLKRELFQSKVGKDVLAARKALALKAKTYYSNEALNPRPKRGRPPKQAAKLEIEPQISTDIFTMVPNEARLFLFTPDYTSSFSVTFSSKFDTEEELLASRRAHATASADLSLESLNQKLAALRTLSSRWLDTDDKKAPASRIEKEKPEFSEEEEDEEEEEEESFKKEKINGIKPASIPVKKAVKTPPSKKTPVASAAKTKKTIKPMPAPKGKPIVSKSNTKAPVKPKPKAAPAAKKPPMRSIINSKPKTKPKPIIKSKTAPKKAAPVKVKKKR